MKTSDDDIEHFDLLGEKLYQGDIVVVGVHSTDELKICKILYLTKKMVKVAPLKGKSSSLRYPFQIVKIDKEKAIEYIFNEV